MYAFLQGLRPAMRSLARNRAFTVAAVLTLGLGMGASTAIYTIIQRVVLDPLPYPHADRLVRLKNPVPGVGKNAEWSLSKAQFFYYGAHAPSLAAIGSFREDGMNLAAGAEPRRVVAAAVTASMMDLLGARAVRGRVLDRADDTPGAQNVVALSYDFWRSQFGGDTAIVGRTIQLDEEPFQVVGVLAPGLALPPDRGQTVRTQSDVWLTFKFNPAGPFQNNHVFPAIARLADGATIGRAQAELDHLQRELPQAFPSAYSENFFKGTGFHAQLYELKRDVVGDVARNLWIILGAVALVMIIACANVTNLLLVRLEGRRREFAIRSTLGASWRDLAGDALREGLVLSLAGAAFALLIGYTSTRWLVSLAPPGLPRLENVRLDWRVFVFTLVLAALIAGALAIVPVLQARWSTGVAALGDGGRAATAGVDRQRLRGALVVSQVALALVLVVSSGLLIRSFSRLRAVNPGVDPHGVLAMQLYLPTQRYDSLYKSWQFYDRALAKVRAIPGVELAGVSEALPFESGYGCTVQGFEDQAVYKRLKDAHEGTCAGQEASTTPGYFEALRIPLLAGRVFISSDNDSPDAGAVIVSKAFAGRFWPGEDPIGKGVNPSGNTSPPFYHVVGMVGDVFGESVDQPSAIAIYYPVVPMPGAWRFYPGGVWLLVRVSRGSPLGYLPAIRRAVAQVDAAIPLANAEEMEMVVARSMSRLTFTMTLLAIAGALALLLAAIGLYGLISYIVARRTNEIGVRLALGAQPSQVEGMVVRGALRLAGAGVVLGIAGAALSSRLLAGLLYGVTAWDPASYFVAALALSAVATLAAWLPARRAAAVDPAVALRSE
jgi:predicted permease